MNLQQNLQFFVGFFVKFAFFGGFFLNFAAFLMKNQLILGLFAPKLADFGAIFALVGAKIAPINIYIIRITCDFSRC